ncbi:MAG: hypothetical protein KQA41_02020 [Candidatus Aenigmarchaeota archaeon]|nr:hypothetical protein [Candidatus Aenigmarchaeota archaeon]
MNIFANFLKIINSISIKLLFKSGVGRTAMQPIAFGKLKLQNWCTDFDDVLTPVKEGSTPSLRFIQVF